VQFAADWVGSVDMEHEVFVPFPAERLRRVLADPARVARAVPGLQQDAGAEPVTGRLKLRVGSHSITYRGSVRVTGQDDDAYAIEGDATESRGSGAVELALTVRVRDTDDGTTLTFAGTASADGRIREMPQDAVTSAVLRLLDRFAENLGTAAGEEPEEPGAATAPSDTAPSASETPQAAGTPQKPKTPETPEPAATEDDAHVTAEPAAGDARSSVFDTEVPPPSLDPEADDEFGDDAVSAAPMDGDGRDGEDIAEAAHARRTMIGRSAEEVDHAPPRGRYAPVPAPQSVAAQTPLRWAAPAAAVVLASAIVVGRVLRKRR
jgi:carbon monoxide dehydrogenase subunit G